ncbi:MAG: hypothetical protein KAY24_09255 [Candidatus Eisenbacteria sp.]|nr:hypothetical protein [Candidatus Eisenbacteria bacterium]
MTTNEEQPAVPSRVGAIDSYLQLINDGAAHASAALIDDGAAHASAAFVDRG